MRRAIHIFLITLALFLVGLEIGLTYADPYGLHYIHELSVAMRTRAVGPVEAYQLAPGKYQFINWSATVNPDLTRHVPNSGEGCRLVLFGDSVTWGWAVNDDETFANHLARLWPDATIINRAIPGYNTRNVLESVQTTPYDAALYLLYNNDFDRAPDFGGGGVASGDFNYPGFSLIPGGISVLWAYSVYGAPLIFPFLPSNYKLVPEPDRFWNDLEQLATFENMQWIAFDDYVGRAITDRYDITLIPVYTESISRADNHPTPASHAQIANAIASVIADPCSAA